MVVVRVTLDQHTLDRLEALSLLQKEQDPHTPWDSQDALRQALARGLDALICEALVGSKAHRSHPRRHSLRGASA